MPSNERTLASDDARKVVERELGDDGTWNVEFMIDPDTGLYFYRVENRRFDSRKFYWIDAASGRIQKKYDGLTTGQGTGVKGDTKDLTGLTSFTGSVFELRAGDGRRSRTMPATALVFPCWANFSRPSFCRVLWEPTLTTNGLIWGVLSRDSRPSWMPSSMRVSPMPIMQRFTAATVWMEPGCQ